MKSEKMQKDTANHLRWLQANGCPLDILDIGSSIRIEQQLAMISPGFSNCRVGELAVSSICESSMKGPALAAFEAWNSKCHCLTSVSNYCKIHGKLGGRTDISIVLQATR